MFLSSSPKFLWFISAYNLFFPLMKQNVTLFVRPKETKILKYSSWDTFSARSFATSRDLFFWRMCMTSCCLTFSVSVCILIHFALSLFYSYVIKVKWGEQVQPVTSEEESDQYLAVLVFPTCACDDIHTCTGSQPRVYMSVCVCVCSCI